MSTAITWYRRITRWFMRYMSIKQDGKQRVSFLKAFAVDLRSPWWLNRMSNSIVQYKIVVITVCFNSLFVELCRVEWGCRHLAVRYIHVLVKNCSKQFLTQERRNESLNSWHTPGFITVHVLSRSEFVLSYNNIHLVRFANIFYSLVF